MQGLYDEIEVLRTNVGALGTKIEEAKAKYDEAWEHISYLGGIVGELNGKRIERNAKQENVQKLQRNLKELADSDDELQSMLEKYEERMILLQQNADEQKQRYMQLQQELQQNRTLLSAKEREYGSYEAQKASHERQLENREQLVKQTARRHNIRGYDLEINDEQVRTFLERINKMARDQNAAFERARQETNQELQQAQSVLNHINEQKSALTQHKDTARTTINSNDRRIQSHQSELNKIDVDEGSKAALELTVDDVTNRLGSAKSDFESSQWESHIKEVKGQLRSLDDQKEKLESEMVEGTKRAGESARLDFVKKELKERQQSLATMVGAHGDRIGEVVRDRWEPSTLENLYNGALEQSNAHIAEAERQRDGTTRELEQLRFKLNTCQSDLKRKRNERQTSEQTVRDAIDDEPSEFPEQLATVEKNRDMVYSDAESFKHMKKYYNECMETAQQHKLCRLCRRDFEKDNKAYNNFLKILERQISMAGQPDVMQDAEEVEADLKTIRAAGPSYDTWVRLSKTEIPALEAEEAKLKVRHESLISEVEQQDQTVGERVDQKRNVEGLSKTVQTIAKYNSEIAGFEKQIKELSAKQSTAGMSRGLEQTQDDLKAVTNQTRATKSELDKLTDDRDRARATINSLELESRDAQSKLNAAAYHLKEKVSLETQVDELKAANGEQRESMRSIDQDIQALGPQLSQAQVKYDDIARRGAEKDRQLREETTGLNDSVSRLQMADKEISNYIDRGGPQQLSRARSAIDNMKAETSRIEQEMNAITKEVKHTEGQLRNHEDTKRSICDNQDYRRDKRALEQVSRQIQELEAHNAETEKMEYEREAEQWATQRNKLTADQAEMMGDTKRADKELERVIKDYETEYKDAAYKYKEAHIKVETTKAAIVDLGRYGGAIDKAIMKSHTLKMDEINRIVEELWRRTYQGSDVDTILIRSENENVKGNKSYNYRVCMVKSDVEMDMRGRCSAGQKVLASIIIRLALAECFGVNCGLIALDEPTTNLDQDNIKALAESLAEIIRVRRQQSNFQLIVITHDEDFLRHMQCADFADYYYRVHRNESQKSMIDRQNIAEVSL